MSGFLEVCETLRQRYARDETDPLTGILGIAREVMEISITDEDLATISLEDVAALALDAATHTAVLLGEDDKPVRRAIYWTDTRASAEAAQLKREMGPALMEECYNSVSSLWTLPQLMWLKKHEPETLRKTRKVLAVKDYVRYRMTGDYVTDTIEAMGFLLLDARKNQWSETLCAMAGLDVRLMPPIVEPTTHLSPLTAQA